MPLDAAEFISELSITDPPGTDPLNQGDDHIRTVKRATQQSFPNVNAAVPQTAAQMAQMAIKNEINTFTQRQLFANGTDALPGVAFASTPDMGMFITAVGRLGFATGGLERMSVNDVSLNLQQPILNANGTALLPAYAFSAQPDTGTYRAANNILAWTVAGVVRMSISNTTLAFSNIDQMRHVDGTAAAPAYSFNNALGMGMFRASSSKLDLSVLGVTRFSMDSAENLCAQRLTMNQIIRFNNFNSDHGLQWRANGSLTWEIQAIHSLANHELQFIRYSGGVFADAPFRIEGTTGIISMTTLPTTNPGGSGRLWKSGGFVAVT